MPVLHQYADKPGMYVRTRTGQLMSTYQLTPAAVAELRGYGLRDGDRFSQDLLQTLVTRRLAFTGGSGAGYIDEPDTITIGSLTLTVNLDVRVGGFVPSRLYTPPAPVRPSSYRVSPSLPFRETYASPSTPRQLVGPPVSTPSAPVVLPEPAPAPKTLLEDLAELRTMVGPLFRAAGCAVLTLIRQIWAVVVFEILDIPLWLWIYMGIGAGVPAALLGGKFLGYKFV